MRYRLNRQVAKKRQGRKVSDTTFFLYLCVLGVSLPLGGDYYHHYFPV
jgi:hypothetical protein